MKNYVYAYSNADNNACVIEKIRFDSRQKNNSGHSPYSSRLLMTPDPHYGSEFQDVIRDSKFSFIVSKRLKEFLMNQNLLNNGFIPASIINDKNQILTPDYFVVHQTIHQNCIDMEKSIVTRNLRNPNLIARVDRLVIDESLIDEKVLIFRPKYYPNLLIVQKQLANKIIKSKFTGIDFDEIKNYNQFKTL